MASEWRGEGLGHVGEAGQESQASKCWSFVWTFCEDRGARKAWPCGWGDRWCPPSSVNDDRDLGCNSTAMVVHGPGGDHSLVRLSASQLSVVSAVSARFSTPGGTAPLPGPLPIRPFQPKPQRGRTDDFGWTFGGRSHGHRFAKRFPIQRSRLVADRSPPLIARHGQQQHRH